jgi:hypothetical protein
MSEGDQLELARRAKKYAMLSEWWHQERTWGEWAVILLAVYGFMSLLVDIWRRLSLLDGW